MTTPIFKVTDYTNRPIIISRFRHGRFRAWFRRHILRKPTERLYLIDSDAGVVDFQFELPFLENQTTTFYMSSPRVVGKIGDLVAEEVTSTTNLRTDWYKPSYWRELIYVKWPRHRAQGQTVWQMLVEEWKEGKI